MAQVDLGVGTAGQAGQELSSLDAIAEERAAYNNKGGKVDMRAKFYNNGGVTCGPKVKRSGIYKH